jgi:ABC-2 type transport system permease protein
MNLARVRTIMRREYLTTIRRKAFVFTLIGFPAYFAFVMFLSVGPQVKERTNIMKKFTALGVVDSSGAFANAAHEIRSDVEVDPLGNASKRETFHTAVRFYPDQAAALSALDAGEVTQVLVAPPDFLTTGKLRRYGAASSIFGGGEDRPIGRWIVRSLLAGHADEAIIDRVAQPTRGMEVYARNKEGRFELKDDKRELGEFMLPFMFAMMMGMSIVVGGQYLLQGVAEEKESRILESLMTTVSPEELLTGKLLGLGGAGLTMAGSWIALSSFAFGPGLLALGIHVPVTTIVIGIAYFVLGYLFYGSLMTGIAGVTSNMREAQQFAFAFTFMNFAPMLFLSVILAHPEGGAATALSMFPPTAAGSMMLRLFAPTSAVPAWQIALSLVIVASAAWLAIQVAARLFRVGILMYGKTPTLPEIVRWVRQA